MRHVFLLAPCILVAACATNSDAGNTQVSAVSTASVPRYVDQSEVRNPDRDDVVCRYEAPTGTRMRERICRTQEEWDAIQEAGRERIRHRQSTGYNRY